MEQKFPNNFILNGFDRSGSSAISRVLATHPDIEIIMQPFNSGSIRDKLYQIIDGSKASEADIDFFNKLEKGVLERSYIKSKWHDQHSSVPDFVAGKLHLIKTTQNHFTISWVRQQFPAIENWGIWRDPLEILASLIRNDFHITWYNQASLELAETVRHSELLSSTFEIFIAGLTNPVREMAFNIATRSWFYFYHLETEKILYYREFSRDCNHSLAPVLEYFDLSPFTFETIATNDLNITGKQFAPGSSHLDYIPDKDRVFCDKLFLPLYELMGRLKP